MPAMSTAHNMPADKDSSTASAKPPLVDHEFVQKLLHHERCVREVKNQWPFEFPWSGSVGIDPRALAGPSKRSISPGKENNPPKRPRTKSVGVNSDETGHIAAASSGASSVQTTTRALMKRSNGDHIAQPLVSSASPGPSASAQATTPQNGQTSDVESANESDSESGEDYVRCYIRGCKSTVRRRDCKEHMLEHHKDELGPTGIGARECRWSKCKKGASDYNVLVRHYESVHFKNERFVCERCGDGFTRSDLLKRHERKYGH
ncbi:hypothetical protein GY45DRAFT_1438293 [Cubamyces sp. BRFM 1775]|nr:hypothetical protein GY45DRAFT_1438293 [Cubamyces sp. BRFM 1775]